jgi:hypothetical protein
MKSTLLITAFAGILSMVAFAAPQTPAPRAADPAKSSTQKKATTAATAPTDAEIADARAKGLVWVNTSSKVFHKDGEFYGKTKHGKFMTEDEARKHGYKAAKEPASKKHS